MGDHYEIINSALLLLVSVVNRTFKVEISVMSANVQRIECPSNEFGDHVNLAQYGLLHCGELDKCILVRLGGGRMYSRIVWYMSGREENG